MAGRPSASRFHAQFDWTGTDDPTARLSVPTAFSGTRNASARPGGLPYEASNHALVHQGRELLTAALDTDTPTPAEMIGSIASLPIPLDRYPGHNALDVVESLHDNWSIEVPVSPWPTPEDRLLRISAQQYNTLNDYELLARALTHS